MTKILVKNKRPNRIFINSIELDANESIEVEKSDEVKKLLNYGFIEQIGETKDEGTSKKLRKV